MRSAALSRLLTFAATCAPLTCSLVRDFDGFSDHYDSGVEAGSDASDAGDATLFRDAIGDGPIIPGKPPVSCELVPIADIPLDRDASGYPYAIAVDDQSVFLATGVYYAPPDSGLSTRDSGVILRLDKTGDAATALLVGEPVPYKAAAHDGTVFYASTARDGGSLYRLYARAPDGAVTELLSDINLPELATGRDGLFVGLRTSGLVGLFPWDASADAAVWHGVGGPVRVVADDNRLVVQRPVTEAGVSSYASASWATPQSVLEGCTLDGGVGTILELALSADRFFYTQLVSSSRELFAADRTTCAQVPVSTLGRVDGLTANERFLFVRYPDKVELFWADDMSASACGLPLDEATKNPHIYGVNVATFDPTNDDVFFILPPFVYRLKVTVGP